MKNLKKNEQLMMTYARRANPDHSAAFEQMVTVYRFYDGEHHTNHCQIINFLYNTNKKKKFTYLAIAQKFNTSDNALRRYRKEYAAMFCFFIEEERKKHVSDNHITYLKAL